MCLLGIILSSDAGAPLFVLVNREEFYARPSEGPQLFSKQSGIPAWLGGRDRLAGGTWLGVNQHGLLVALTNRRTLRNPQSPPSRGILCRSLLAHASIESALADACRQLDSGQFAGCNLIVAAAGRAATPARPATLSRAAAIESYGEPAVTWLSAGLHLLTNGSLNDPLDPRIARTRNELSRVPTDSTAGWIAAAQKICALTGESPAVAHTSNAAICLRGPDRGTVSSTVLSLAPHPEDQHFWHAPGYPATTAYEDHSHLLRSLLALPGGARSHRIQLRGPWKYRVGELSAAGAESPSSHKGETGTVQFPLSAAEFAAKFTPRLAQGERLELRRRFQSPPNIGPSERVLLHLDGFPETSRLTLNDTPLGPARSTTAFEIDAIFDITPRLRDSNELCIAFTAASASTLSVTLELETRE
jgi:uncharacterized protein with NRDE domain